MHDSILFQYPIDKIEMLPETLHKIYWYINPTLSWQGRSIQVETDMKVGLNWGEMKEIPLLLENEEMIKSIKGAIDELEKAE